ncbi:MAG: hypothetical protein A4C66_04605 [Nitrospira sp. HN-bin3]|nr:MAG: hypothetical protein A4C66_04605 [Nitrospira sp. HN-bin3]
MEERDKQGRSAAMRFMQAACCSQDTHEDHLLFAEAASDYTLRSGLNHGQGLGMAYDGLECVIAA